MGKRNKKPYTCHLTQEQFDSLHELNRITKVPISVLIREGIDMVLEKRNKQIEEWKKEKK